MLFLINLCTHTWVSLVIAWHHIMLHHECHVFKKNVQTWSFEEHVLRLMGCAPFCFLKFKTCRELFLYIIFPLNVTLTGQFLHYILIKILFYIITNFSSFWGLLADPHSVALLPQWALLVRQNLIHTQGSQGLSGKSLGFLISCRESQRTVDCSYTRAVY